MVNRIIANQVLIHQVQAEVRGVLARLVNRIMANQVLIHKVQAEVSITNQVVQLTQIILD